MIRNHPDALAILAILTFLPGICVLENIGQGIRWGVPTVIHRELRMQREQMQWQRDQLRLERDRFREELHRAFRFRSI